MLSWVIGMLLGATGFGAAPAPAEIIGGVPTDPSEFQSVIAVFNGPNICTGTMVGPDLVLTAAHCLDGLAVGAIRVAMGSEVSPSSTLPILDYGVHPDYCRECSASDDDIFDYGYIRLAPETLPITEFAVPIVDQEDWDSVFDGDAEITVVGYGQDDDGRLYTKRQVVTSIRDQTPSGQEFFAGGDFRDSCLGDSGGPAFVRLSDGRWRQAGIVSRGSKPCGRGGTYAAPYPALSWLQDETRASFCGDDCGDCTCLDTTAPPESQGCGCRSTPSPTAWWSLVPIALFGRRRRRVR